MADVVAPPDAEALVVAYLRAQFAASGETARVATKVPNPRPDRLVRLSLADTTRQTLAHFAARLIIECWDATEPAASALARITYALVHAMDGENVGADWVAAVVEVGGLVNFPDPDTGAARYQFTVDVLMRGDIV
ncbi:hypothetical protein [Nocardia sp. NPDC052566]|uniref:hypothetical protein n=1 Tax=Nocardia sp. NPDC052566 TaxID=3364330 RepID=UPI0037C52451